MDLNEITRLVRAIEAAQKMKFSSAKQSSDWHAVSISDAGYLPLSAAEELAAELNAAITPIVKKYESNLRKELARCAK